MMQQELDLLRDAVLRSPVRALQDLRDWTYEYFAHRRVPRREKWRKAGLLLANFATRLPESEFCRRLAMILDRTEEKLQVVEDSTEEWFEEQRVMLGTLQGTPNLQVIKQMEESWTIPKKVRLGLLHFRRWMVQMRHFAVPGQAANEFHNAECPDKKCRGYCTFHRTNKEESIRVFSEDFGVSVRKDGSTRIFSYYDPWPETTAE